MIIIIRKTPASHPEAVFNDELRHDGEAKALHWDLYGQCEFERSDKWYEHSPENVEDNEKCKLLTGTFRYKQTRNSISTAPDIVLVDKQSKVAL